MLKRSVVCLAVGTVLTTSILGADDWPQYRGPDRLGAWHETGIVDRFPPEGLSVRWRTPIESGYGGPVVADGRVFVTDFSLAQGLNGIERVVALDEETGDILWTQEWEVDYRGVSSGIGPAASPTVEGNRVYVQGASGILVCLEVTTGQTVWQTHHVSDRGAALERWPWFYGFVSSPLIDGPRVISTVGGRPNAMVVALDKQTGEEIWRTSAGTQAVDSDLGPGTGYPFIINAGGTRQLIVWHSEAVVSLNPVTGETYWDEPFAAYAGITSAGPVHSGSHLFFSTFYSGPLMLELDDDTPNARVLWKGTSDSEIQTDGLHSLLAPPLIQDGYIYGVCSYGQFRCLNAATGERVWETQEVMSERARLASAFIVRNGDRVFINNDRGELIMARLSPEGYEELGRTMLIEPTTPAYNRRALRKTNIVHPAYANRRIYIRNDEEIICVSLAAEDYPTP